MLLWVGGVTSSFGVCRLQCRGVGKCPGRSDPCSPSILVSYTYINRVLFCPKQPAGLAMAKQGCSPPQATLGLPSRGLTPALASL